MFLGKDRYADKTSAHLIASGPRGMIHFWTVFQGSEILAVFSVVIDNNLFAQIILVHN